MALHDETLALVLSKDGRVINGYAMTLLRVEMDEAGAEEETGLDGLPAFRP